MFMNKVNECSVRASVSVLAMVFSASMALANEDQTTAGTDDTFQPEVVVCEIHPDLEVVAEGSIEEELGIKFETIDGEQDLPELVSGEVGDSEDMQMSYMIAASGLASDMVKRDVVATQQVTAAHDPAAVPNLCAIAGSGLDWLCGAKAR